MNRVAAEHKITAEEYGAMLSFRNEITPADAELLKNLNDQDNT